MDRYAETSEAVGRGGAQISRDLDPRALREGPTPILDEIRSRLAVAVERVSTNAIAVRDFANSVNGPIPEPGAMNGIKKLPERVGRGNEILELMAGLEASLQFLHDQVDRLNRI